MFVGVEVLRGGMAKSRYLWCGVRKLVFFGILADTVVMRDQCVGGREGGKEKAPLVSESSTGSVSVPFYSAFFLTSLL